MTNLMDEKVFTPTEQMIARHQAWVDDVVTAVWGEWEKNGEVAAFPEKAQDGIQVVRDELSLPDRPQWMHPLDSLAMVTGIIGDPDPDQRADFADALRTHAGLGEQGRVRWVAQAMGMSVASAKKYAPTSDRPPRKEVGHGRTALYRHFDRFGRLLYVGIAKDPDQRFTLHAYTSVWHPHSAECQVEWFDSREDALRAEREAILKDRPLFNIRGSVVDPDDAQDYLMFLEICAEASDPIG